MEDREPESKLEAGRAEASSRRRTALFIIIGLSLAGVVLSAELLRIHLTVSKDPLHPFACRVSETVDCNAVALSSQSVFLGVPVPVWTLLFYSLFIFLAGCGLRGRRVPFKNAADYCLPLSLWAVGYSGYLAYVSAFVLKVLCIYCAGLYVVNLGLLVASVPAASPLGEYLVRREEDFRWLFGDLWRAVAAGVVLVALVITLSVLQVSAGRSNEILWSGVRIDVSEDPKIGPDRARVTIIEFGDFECPACRRMHKTMRALLERYAGSIRFIHKDYPLDSSCNPGLTYPMHPHACLAAAAAECAFRMGKFKSYSERLWTARDLSEPSLVKMAEDEGLDPEAFRSCLESEEVKKAILADIETGDRLKVEATPTFFVNGYKFTGYYDVKWCSRLIDKLLSGEPLSLKEQ